MSVFSDNLTALRRLSRRTQEEVAEQIGVSRQALAKWESGETLPDIERCRLLAQLYGVSLDELVSHDGSAFSLPVPPRGKHLFGVVRVGDKGQIVIPQAARRVFGIQPGDTLVVLGDEAQGLALIREADMLAMADAIRRAAADKED
ncbi:MAG: helix-turn-helix domain-containing protein [Clostridia bacterium]|nr:helix-turn-helix domain-containing protein [Clostridia bacterium]